MSEFELDAGAIGARTPGHYGVAATDVTLAETKMEEAQVTWAEAKGVHMDITVDGDKIESDWVIVLRNDKVLTFKIGAGKIYSIH